MIKMIKDLIEKIKIFFAKNREREISVYDLRSFLDGEKERIKKESENKSKEDQINLNSLINKANTSLNLIAQLRANDELEETQKDKIRDAILDYVNDSRKFLKSFIQLDYNRSKFIDLLEFSENLISEYENLVKDKKQFLENFFAKEMEESNSLILEFKNKLIDLSHSFTEDKIKIISTINEISEKIINIELQKSDLTEKRTRMSDNLNKIKDIKEKHLNKLEQFKMSPDFSKFHETLSKKKVVMDKLSSHRELFEHDFEKVRAAIVYYQSKYYKNVFNKYYEEPYEAFLEDEGEKFSEALNDLYDKVASGNEIPIDPDKKKICLDQISKWSKQNLTVFFDEYKTLKEQKFKYDRILSSDKLMDDYTELEYKIDHINSKLKDQNEILREVISELNLLNINKFLEEAQELLKEVFGYKFIISVPKMRNVDNNKNLFDISKTDSTKTDSAKTDSTKVDNFEDDSF